MPRIRVRQDDGGVSELEWVDWVDEPRHRLLFSNAHTRIYDARFPAGTAASTMFHRHTQDTVYACVSGPGPGGSVYSEALELEGGIEAGVARLLPRVHVEARSGWCFCMLHRTNTYIHRALTEDGNNSPVRFVGCEVLAPPAVTSAAPLNCAGYALELSEQRFRAYRLTLAPGEATGVHSWTFGGVFMCLTPASLLATSAASPFSSNSTLMGDCKPGTTAAAVVGPSGPPVGEFVWFDGPITHELRNVGLEPFEALVVEWLTQGD